MFVYFETAPSIGGSLIWRKGVWDNMIDCCLVGDGAQQHTVSKADLSELDNSGLASLLFDSPVRDVAVKLPRNKGSS